ncbi:hypothetical protein TRVA0_005S01640 [Trichomonascus vanleenenianus]|uniref:chloride channel protein n=1 Tax=Trichomonascus vanleenenianus TaxID=2268995 RepID=UPI003ECA756A
MSNSPRPKMSRSFTDRPVQYTSNSAADLRAESGEEPPGSSHHIEARPNPLQRLLSRSSIINYLSVPELPAGPSLRSAKSSTDLKPGGDYNNKQRHHRRKLSGAHSSGIRHYDAVSGPLAIYTPTLDAANPVMARNFYDDFTTIDWTRDTIKESERLYALQKLPGLRGRVMRATDGLIGWMLIVIIGFVFAAIAAVICVAEGLLSDIRQGYCSSNWLLRESQCHKAPQGQWIPWSEAPAFSVNEQRSLFSFLVYFAASMAYAFVAVRLTMCTKMVNPLTSGGSMEKGFDEYDSDTEPLLASSKPKRVFYTAYGSGVPEVKTILSGFVIRGFLGTYTLLIKIVGVVFAVSSGLCVGKEGPFVHIATCVGNITCRLSKKFSQNDMKRRQILAAAAGAGVALAFGSPLGGVLFGLEEVSYYILPQQLFRMFFCTMVSTLFFKFMDPYGTGKVVVFDITYPKEGWETWELLSFSCIGIIGGLFGALFCKFNMWWGKSFRQHRLIKDSPVFEVLLIAVITTTLQYSNQFTIQPVQDLIYDVARPCEQSTPENPSVLCPSTVEEIPPLLKSLGGAFLMKAALTAVTFGIKTPAGIYIPLMVAGGLFGRLFGLSLQYFDYSSTKIFPATYAMAGMGAFMAGVTRMNVTLGVILFELSGSLDHVIPFSLAILTANWVANAIEPMSIYELLIRKNNFPFLDNRRGLPPSIADRSLSDLVTVLHRDQVIDITNSDYVSVTRLSLMLNKAQERYEFDTCFPIVINKGSCTVLWGMISAPELEYALDTILASQDGDSDGDLICRFGVGRDYDDDESERELRDNTDLSAYIDRAPITLDIHSSIAMVYLMFTKMGSRVIAITQDGEFLGIVHRKKFIEFAHSYGG